MSTLLAQRSLVQHVAAVADGLDRGLAEGRRAVARIVGRDPERLDRAGRRARAAIESLAENLSDGVVAPLFWGVVAGPAGHARLQGGQHAGQHGRAQERALPAFRLGERAARRPRQPGAGPAHRRAPVPRRRPRRRRARRLRAMRRDAPQHRSPNAGWPEAAMAAALGLRLDGPRIYGGVRWRTPGWATGGPRRTPPTSAARCGSPGRRGGCSWPGSRRAAAHGLSRIREREQRGRGRGSARDGRRARPAPPRRARRRRRAGRRAPRIAGEERVAEGVGGEAGRAGSSPSPGRRRSTAPSGRSPAAASAGRSPGRPCGPCGSRSRGPRRRSRARGRGRSASGLRRAEHGRRRRAGPRPAASPGGPSTPSGSAIRAAEHLVAAAQAQHAPAAAGVGQDVDVPALARAGRRGRPGSTCCRAGGRGRSSAGQRPSPGSRTSRPTSGSAASGSRSSRLASRGRRGTATVIGAPRPRGRARDLGEAQHVLLGQVAGGLEPGDDAQRRRGRCARRSAGGRRRTAPGRRGTC